MAKAVVKRKAAKAVAIVPRAEPVPIAERWTEARRATFLTALAETANVKAAARAAGVPEISPYHLRARDPAFRAAWEEALDAGYARLELLLLERATYGEGLADDSAPAIPTNLALALLRMHQGRGRRAPIEPIPPMRGARLRNELIAKFADMNARMLAGEPASEARAFEGFVRRGETVGVKSFSGATQTDGGYAVPREIDETIDATLKAISPIRRIANVVRVGTAGYRKLVTQNGVASGWVAETGARPETGTPTFNEIVPPMRGELEGGLGEGAGRAARTIEGALIRAVRTGKLGFEDLKRVALSALDEIAAASIRSRIGSILNGGGGGSGGGGLLSAIGSLFGAPGRATGGPVSPGRAYVVGERGPELFVPTSSGSVAANVRGGGRDVRVAITGDSIRGVAETIASALPFSLAVTNGPPLARFGAGPAKPVLGEDAGATADDRRAERISFDRASPDTLPELLTLDYADVARDYQPGQQRARRDAGGRREARVDFAATLAASDAKAIAEARLGRFWAERTRAKLSLPWRSLEVAPGDVIDVPGTTGGWRVTETALEHMVARLTLVPAGSGAAIVAPADSGRNLAQPDLEHGATVLALIDLPQIGDTPLTEPMLAVAANGTSSGWRRAALLSSTDGGLTYDALGSTAAPATIGVAATVLAARGCDLIDTVSSVEVTLANEGLTLNDADVDAIKGGANLALIGNELLQFEHAEPMGGVRWRLSRLWRGRRGSEAEVGGHVAGEPFVLVEDAALFYVPAARIAPNLRVMAVGVGDDAGVVAVGLGTPVRALLPLSPAALTATASGSDVVIGWIRRSRDGWRWRDDVDAPVAEEREAYRVTRGMGSSAVNAEVAGSSWTYTAAMRSADAAAGVTTAPISVRQIGSFGLSPAATTTLTL